MCAQHMCVTGRGPRRRCVACIAMLRARVSAAKPPQPISTPHSHLAPRREGGWQTTPARMTRRPSTCAVEHSALASAVLARYQARAGACMRAAGGAECVLTFNTSASLRGAAGDDLAEALQRACAALQLRGTVRVADDGVSAALCGRSDAVHTLRGVVEVLPQLHCGARGPVAFQVWRQRQADAVDRTHSRVRASAARLHAAACGRGHAERRCSRRGARHGVQPRPRARVGCSGRRLRAYAAGTAASPCGGADGCWCIACWCGRAALSIRAAPPAAAVFARLPPERRVAGRPACVAAHAARPLRGLHFLGRTAPAAAAGQPTRCP